jgi:hypothetical protein
VKFEREKKLYFFFVEEIFFFDKKIGIWKLRSYRLSKAQQQLAGPTAMSTFSRRLFPPSNLGFHNWIVLFVTLKLQTRQKTKTKFESAWFLSLLLRRMTPLLRHPGLPCGLK